MTLELILTYRYLLCGPQPLGIWEGAESLARGSFKIVHLFFMRKRAEFSHLFFLIFVTSYPCCHFTLFSILEIRGLKYSALVGHYIFFHKNFPFYISKNVFTIRLFFAPSWAPVPVLKGNPRSEPRLELGAHAFGIMWNYFGIIR